MRILYVTFDEIADTGAWTVHVKSVVNRLVRRGHAVRLIGSGRSGPPDLAAEFVPMPRSGRKLNRAAHHLLGSWNAIVRAGRSFRPDVVYCRGIHLSLTPIAAAKWLRAPFIVEVNGLLEAEVGGTLVGPVRATHRIVAHAADHIVTVSERLKNGLCRLYGARADRVSVIPNGADPEQFQPARSKPARKKIWMDEGPTLLHVGGFYPHHALDLLPGLALELCRTVPRFQALIVGDGPERRNIESRIRGEMLDGVVVFAGRVPHQLVPDFVRCGDVGLYLLKRPHRDFGFSPIKLYEYMAAGLPVVVGTDLPEITEFVRYHEIGLATDLHPGRIAEAARTLLTKPKMRKEMGERARALVEKQFSWDRTVDAVEDVLKECVSR